MNSDKIERYISSLVLDTELSEKMHSFRRIIAFSPHPDDMEFSAGGYLGIMARSGASIQIVVVSDGSRGAIGEADVEKLKSTRLKEEIQAASVLGIEDVKFLGYVDSEIPEPRKIRDTLMGLIRNYRPDLVLTVDPYLPYEAHLDHVHVGKAVLEAVLLHSHDSVGEGKPSSPRPYAALSATSTPNLVVNIEEAFDLKAESIRSHRSQMDSAGYVFREVENLSSLFGKAAGFRYGEPFRLMEGEKLHMNLLSGL